MFRKLISNKTTKHQAYKFENSWYLKKGGEHHFFCHCGNHHTFPEIRRENPYLDTPKFKREEIDFAKLPDVYHPDYQCSLCGNERYLDMDALLFDNKTRFWTSVNWAYEERVNLNSWSVTSFVTIPRFDDLLSEIIVEKVELSSYLIIDSGRGYYDEQIKYFLRKQFIMDGEFHPIDKVLKKKMDDKIVDLMFRSPPLSLAWLKGGERDVENLCFFLKNSAVRFRDILYWKNRDYFLPYINKYRYLEPSLSYILNHRKERSLKKVHFQSYEKMMLLGGYNPMVDYIFSRTITDLNHLVKALGMDVSIKRELFDGCAIQNIYYFINFLKNHYQEKHIVRLWLSIDKDDLKHFLLRDTIALFENHLIREELNRRFQKTALNLRLIHHELTRYSRALQMVEEGIKVLTYPDFLIESQVTKEKIEYRLPLKSKDLYNWGATLKNCISSYLAKVFTGKSTIFGLFIDKQLIYAIEIQEHQIVQASSEYNQSVPELDREKIERWYQEVYLKNIVYN